MKKLLLSLGAVAAVAAPVAAVVACSNDAKADYNFKSSDLVGNMRGDVTSTPSGQAVTSVTSSRDTSLDDLAKKFIAAAKTGITEFTFTLDGGDVTTFNFTTDKFKTDGKGADLDTANYLSNNGFFTVDATAGLKLVDGKDADDALTLTQAKYVMRMAVAAKTPLHLVAGKSWTTKA